MISMDQSNGTNKTLEAIQQKIVRFPLAQAGLIFAIALTFALLEWLGKVSGIMNPDPNSPWIIFTSFVLFFSITTSVLSLKSSDMNRYWGRSIIAFAALLVLSGSCAWLLSGLSIDEAGSFRWLFVVLTVGFLVFLSITRLVKRIVDIAIKQDDRLRGE